MGNTALHLAFQCIGTSSGGALPPLHLIQALLLADEESASIVVKTKNTSSSSSSFSYLPLSYTSSSSWKNESKKESKRNRGTTPLHLAVLHKTSPIILSLLLSANPLATDTLDELGRTPLHRACGSIAIGGGDVGSITGDFNEHYYTNYNHTAATAATNDTTSGGTGGLLPLESFQLLAHATTSPYYLLQHKDDRGYTALSYLSRRFEERAIWAVDHMRSACCYAANSTLFADDDEDYKSDEEEDVYSTVDNSDWQKRRSIQKTMNITSFCTVRYSDASFNYPSSFCHSLRSYGLGDFWDRVTTILLRGYSLQYDEEEYKRNNNNNGSSDANDATEITFDDYYDADEDAQKSVLHAALTLLSRGYCYMTIAYLAVSVAHFTDAMLVDSNGRLPLHLAAGAVVDDDDDDDDARNVIRGSTARSNEDHRHKSTYHCNQHHRVRWKRWAEDASTRRRKQKSRKHIRDIIQYLLDIYPHAARVKDRVGFLPFRLAEVSGRRWDDGLGSLLYEYPRSILVHGHEEEKGSKGGDEGIRNDEFQDVYYPHILYLVGPLQLSSSSHSGIMKNVTMKTTIVVTVVTNELLHFHYIPLRSRNCDGEELRRFSSIDFFVHML